jgi:hypothetical protein
MQSCRSLALLIALALGLAGCTGGADKGINRDKEKPVPPETAKQDKSEKK